MNRNKLLFKLSSPKSGGIPPSLHYGATFPALRIRRSSKSEGGFRRSRRVPLPWPWTTAGLFVSIRASLVASGFGREISRTIGGPCTAVAQIVQSSVQDEDAESLPGKDQPFQV